MDKERQSTNSQLKQIERDYTRYFGQPRSPQDAEVLRQGCFTQFTAYENVRVFYAATTGR